MTIIRSEIRTFSLWSFFCRPSIYLTGRFLNSRVSLQAEEITITYRIYSASMQEKQAVLVEVNATVSLLEIDSLSKVQSSGCDLLEMNDSLIRHAERIFLWSYKACIRCYISSACRTAESKEAADKHNTEVREFHYINTMDLLLKLPLSCSIEKHCQCSDFSFFFLFFFSVLKRPVTSRWCH